ncbi:MAG: hypothetical protein E6J91_39835 [Deltaproteobacteria bacterium]|nr:MAG: hypothetical protein E6J91_39835 [Deltaproteobacteria bacterium]
MTQRPPLLDPYDLIGVALDAPADTILAAYARAVTQRPRDAAAIHQAQEDLRQPYKRLAVDMLLALPTASEAEIEQLIDEHAELPPLVSNELAVVLAVGPAPAAGAAPPALAFRADLDDEPILVLELDP